MKNNKEPNAIKFDRNQIGDMKKFVEGNTVNFIIEKCIGGKAYCIITTSKGVIKITEGDYIIKDKNGVLYPCNAETFLKYTNKGGE